MAGDGRDSDSDIAGDGRDSDSDMTGDGRDSDIYNLALSEYPWSIVVGCGGGFTLHGALCVSFTGH